MGNKALCFFAIPLAAWAALSVPHNASAQAADTVRPAQTAETNVVPNRITGYTAWDDEFFYITVQVTKPNAAGTSTKPFTDPLTDDAAVIEIQTDNDHKSVVRTAHTVTVAISQAGGTQVYLGADGHVMFHDLKELTDKLEAIGKSNADPDAQQKQRVALLGSIPKIAVVSSGAPHPGAANYPGYTAEVAIPWSDLGGRPDVGAKMGFNVAALSKSPGSARVQSLASGVHGMADLDNPSLWSEILFANAAKAGSAAELTSPRVIASKPEIDGQIGANEWNRLALYEFGERTAGGVTASSLAATIAARLRPEFKPQPPRPVVTPPVAAVRPAAAPHIPYHVDHLVFAKYEYAYQGDTRKRVQPEIVSNPDHSSALAHHPLEGAGPWFSYDRADWHRGQLAEMRKDGIDVILPVYRGDPAHRRAYADKGLLVLASALEYLKRAGMDYPQVGMCLDCSSLETILGDRADLRDPAAQAVMYGIIRDFYMRVPQEFRCSIAVDPSEGASAVYPVFLSDASACKEWDSAFTAAIRTRFRADFNGADLLFVGPKEFGAKAGLDSYISDAQGDAAAGGWIKTVGVGAGFDIDAARGLSPAAATLTPRNEGATYRTEWTSAIGKRPDWVLIKNWNDFTLGGEAAPSLEAGFGLSDATRIYTHLFNGADRKLHAKFLWTDSPRTCTAGAAFTLHVRVQNAGIESWGAATGPQMPVNIVYVWRRNGQAVGADKESITSGAVLSGADVNIALKIRTDIKGNPLPAGDYVLEIGAVDGKGGAGTIAHDSGNSVLLPFTIAAHGSDAGSVTVIGSDLPRMMETGGVYDVSTTLRNDGAAAWTKAEGYRVTARLCRISDGTNGLVVSPVEAADATAALVKDVAPGEEAAVHLLLPLTDPAGNPLPLVPSDSNTGYAIRWEVAADRGGAVQASVRSGLPAATVGLVSELTPIAISEFDFGVRFMQDGTLPALPGERRQPVTLGVKNVGPQTWKRDSVRIGYHWYYQDGSEFLWEDETTALPQDVPPGSGINNLLAFVTAPPCDGSYFLVWDLKFGDTWASTSEATRVFDSEVHSVQVIGGRLSFTDLAKAYNLNGVTELANTKAGDFDGKGHSFPAALIPPFTDDGVVPAGIWQPYEKTGPESPRHISFKWGSKEPKNNNFIVCRGQRVDLGKFNGKCRVVHMVAASVNANVTTNLKLVFQEPSGESEDLYALSVSRWDQPPVYGEESVFTCKQYHDAGGSKDGTVSLYHYTFVVRDPRKIAAIILPNEPNIRIAAITLER